MLYGPRGILNLARARERKDGERGQILVLFTMVIVVLMVCAAIVIDVGLLRTDGARLQNALDAGALAAAQSLPAKGLPTSNVSAIKTVAKDYVAANYPGIVLPDNNIDFRCIIGADQTTGGPHLIDMPAICNVAANSTWICTAALCWAPCDPAVTSTDVCNAVVLKDSVTQPYTFGRVVGVNSGSTGTLQAAACTGPCGPTNPVDVVLTVDRTLSMAGLESTLVDGANAVLEAYDPTIQHIALGLIGPSSELTPCSTGAYGNVLVNGTLTAPTYQNSSTNNPAVAQPAAGAATLVINRPTNTASGDLLIAAITLNGNVTIPSANVPAGWTRIRVVPSATAMALVTYYKIATGSEPANYTWTLSASGTAVGSIMRFTGENPANPIDTSSQNNSAGVTGTALSATGITTAGNQELLVAVYGTTAKTGTFNPTGANQVTMLTPVQHANAAGPTVAAGTRALATAAASGNKTVTAGATGQWAAQLLAINPVPVESYPVNYTGPFTDQFLADNMAKWIPVGLTGTQNADVLESFRNANGTVNTSSTISKTIGCILPPNDLYSGTDQASPFDFATAYLMGTSVSARHARAGVPTGIIFETDGTPQTQNYTCQQAQTAASAAKARGIEVFTIGFFASNQAGSQCPDGSGTWWHKTVVQSLAAMATNSATVSTNSCDAGENTDNDHFFCVPAANQLADAFRAAAFALASGSRLVQLYPQPIVTGVAGSGGSAGGTTVTISGKYFTEAYSVTFGGMAATSFTVQSDTTITAVSPAHPQGTVDIQVSTPGGSSNITGADHYTYGP